VPPKLRLKDGLVSSARSPILTEGRSRSKMWPCTQTVETSVILETGGLPAWITMPGEMSFLHDHARDGRADGELGIDGGALPFRLVDLLGGNAENLSGCRLFWTSVAASL